MSTSICTRSTPVRWAIPLSAALLIPADTLRRACARRLFTALGLIFLLASQGAAQPIDQDEITLLRKQFNAEQALSKLEKAQEGEVDPLLLTTVALEAALLEKLGPPVKWRFLKRKAIVARLAALGLSAGEELVLAELCYTVSLPDEAERALGRTRDKDSELKNRTDEIVAAHRGEPVPKGGYFRYRGLLVSMEERERHRALDLALERLHALEISGLSWPFFPSSLESNHAKFVSCHGEEGPDFLRRAASLIRKELRGTYRDVRGWIPSYQSEAFRQRIEGYLAALAPLRKDALALIARYDKPEQPQVDEYRKKLEAIYGEYERFVDSNLKKVRHFPPVKGYAIWERVKAGEEALAEVDRYLKTCGLPGLDPSRIEPSQTAHVTETHLLPGREQSNIEDVLWLLLNHVAGRTRDVMLRTDELLIQENRLTPWERWLTRQLKIEAMERYNSQMATSLDRVEREYIAILNDYRKMLGLHPFEVEERCVVSARKHSQEMVDLGYFGHISPVPRNRTPTDRVKLEGFAGGVGENCLASSGFVRARGAFEGWYHSPGHHRLLVSGSPQAGVGAAGGHRMWTMVAGGHDLTWLSLHNDIPPERRDALEAMVSLFCSEVKKEKPSREPLMQLEANIPSVLPFVASAAFAAVHSRSGAHQATAPDLLRFLIEARVSEVWHPLQVAAVAAAIDLMDIGQSTEARQTAFDIVRPLVPGGFDYDPEAARPRRLAAVTEIRKTWEDEAQWRYRRRNVADIKEPERPLDRMGDGPALISPLKVMSRKERRALAKLHGGGSHTERAVELGLAWLASVQDEDGAWRARSFANRLKRTGKEGLKPGRGNGEWEIAMTGLALLAFVNGGNTTLEGEYMETVKKGAGFLLSQIVDYGKFETTSSHYMYSHAMATQALCELYAYTADPYTGLGAQLCTDYIIYAQNGPTGGWRYRAKEAGDMSVTGWVILALNSARKAELDVAGLRDALRFINSVTYPYYFEIGYTSNSNGGHNRLCAVGSMSRLFITGKKQEARLTFNAYRLLKDLPKPGREDFYYWYYGTLFMFQMEGKYWDRWNEALIPALLANQVRDPASPLHGSFTPRGAYSNYGGRLYQTTLGLLMLMTYYRYDREIKPKLGSWTGSVDEAIDPYLKALRESSDPVVIEVTERKMVDKFGTSLVPALIRELKKKGQKKKHRNRFVSLLKRCADPRFETLIIDLLKTEGDAGVRHELVKTLDGLCSSKSVPSLVAFLNNGDRTIRGYAASALGRIGDKAAVKPLTDRLKKEKDGWCQGQIATALQRLAHHESLRTILDDALGDSDQGRLLIRDKLEIMERTGLAKLLLLMKKAEAGLYERVTATLKEHGEWAGVPMALVALESGDLHTRTEAVKVLRAMTRRSFGFDPAAKKEYRLDPLEKWQEWWKKQVAEFGG